MAAWSRKGSRGINRRRCLMWMGMLAAWAASLLACQPSAWAEPWRFGVMADTQWVGEDDGQNPNSVAAGIIRQIQPRFIEQGVKFVVAVGDTADVSTQINLDTRALYAQDLYNAGIGFYPLRGNHEVKWDGPAGSGPEFQRIYPQTQNGVNNATPAFEPGLGVTACIAPPPKTNLNTFVVGANFSSPDFVSNGVSKAGLTYSFDYDNVRCILLDQWTDRGDATRERDSTTADQQGWIDSRLADANRPQHMFVFGHKNLLGAGHKDNLFGNTVSDDDPGDGNGVDVAKLSPGMQAALVAKQSAANRFMGALAAHGVHFYMSGHDHLHYQSLVTSPDGLAKVHQIIGQSCSSKSYEPKKPVSTNDISISEDVYKMGYYVCTVDGPRVTMDYYGAAVAAGKRKFTQTPDLTGKWQTLETFGYSLNGQEFLVPQGQSYGVVQDSTAKAIANGETGYLGTTAKILAGTNESKATTTCGKALTKTVDTGWAPAAGTASDLITLWGLADVAAAHTDAYALSLTYSAANLPSDKVDAGQVVLAAKDTTGKWINAVDANVGGEKRFVRGPFKPDCGLGAYGVDPTTRTAWAVINSAGEFAVTTGGSE